MSEEGIPATYFLHEFILPPTPSTLESTHQEHHVEGKESHTDVIEQEIHHHNAFSVVIALRMELITNLHSAIHLLARIVGRIEGSHSSSLSSHGLFKYRIR